VGVIFFNGILGGTPVSGSEGAFTMPQRSCVAALRKSRCAAHAKGIWDLPVLTQISLSFSFGVPPVSPPASIVRRKARLETWLHMSPRTQRCWQSFLPGPWLYVFEKFGSPAGKRTYDPLVNGCQIRPVFSIRARPLGELPPAAAIGRMEDF
jgi:hypothetical protein